MRAKLSGMESCASSAAMPCDHIASHLPAACTTSRLAALTLHNWVCSAPSRLPYCTHPYCSLHHKIDVTSASKNYSVWTAFGSGIAGSAAAPERAWPADPRLPALGRRSETGAGRVRLGE